MRNDISPGLFGCTFCNALPAFLLRFRLFCIQFYNCPFRCHRDDLIHSKLYCFLNDQFHFIALWQPLEQINFRWQLTVCLFHPHNVQLCHIFFISGNFAAILFSGTFLMDADLFSNLKAQYIFHMIQVASADDDLFFTDCR